LLDITKDYTKVSQLIEMYVLAKLVLRVYYIISNCDDTYIKIKGHGVNIFERTGN